MLSVNLLPQKESRFPKIAFGYVLAGVLIFGVGTTTYFTNHSLEKEAEKLRQQNVLLNAEIAAVQAQLEGNGSVIESKYNQLSELLSTLRIYDPYTVEMFTSFIGLLPEVGYIMELDFDHVEATISCQVRFDHYREAGYFQSRLQNASWTTDVLLTAVEHIDDLPVTRYDASYEIQLKRESWVSEKIREALGGMDQLSLEAKEDTQDE